MTNRREFLGCLLGSAGACALAQNSPDHGSLMWAHIVGSIRSLDEERMAKLAALRTRQELLVLQREVRLRLAEMWGPFPHRTPLNARHAGTVERSGYVIEKIVYESRPAFLVTANVYRPRQAQGRLPAVIFPCGHSANGKAAAAYQRFCILMARNRFVVLTWDPVGQGERLQLWDHRTQSSLAGGTGTREHGVLGRQCYLLGISLMQYFVWDAIRGIDYLETRADVDPDRIGCAGNSGGGMQTLQLAPFETRIQAAVPMCAVATFRHKTEGLLIADPEQILYGTLGYGIDHPELLAAVAPRPSLIGAAIQDYVPIDGARRTHGEIGHVYKLMGAPEKVGLVETDDKHGLNQDLREAAATWLVRWLAAGSHEVQEQHSEVERDEDLFCTDSGQAAESLGGETVFTLNQKLAGEIAPRRPLPATRGQVEVYRREIALKAQQITRVEFSKPEPGVFVPTRRFAAGSPGKAAVVVAAEAGKDDPDLHRNIIAPLAEAGHRVVGVDVRGWGETAPQMPDKRAGFSWDDFFAYRSLELGRPLFGQRLRDLLATASEVSGSDGWTVIGVGVGALLAAHAAVLEPRVRQVAAMGGLLSYRSLIDDPLYRQPFSSFLPGVIGAYEVRDLYAAIAPRKLLIVNPEDARRQSASAGEARRQLDWAFQIYRLAGAPSALSLRCAVSDPELGSLLADWLAG